MEKNKKKIYLLGIIGCAVVLIGIVTFYLFAPVNKGSEEAYLYIDNDDNIDSLSMKLNEKCHGYGEAAVMAMARHTSMKEHLRTGRYLITTSMGSLQLFRHLRNGQQEPVKLTIPQVRTKEDLAEGLASKLMMDKDDILLYLNDNDSCKNYGKDTATIVCLFIPDTYEVYWNISTKKLFSKMDKAYKTFWSGERMTKANALELTPEQVITIASIVDEETANNGEKPMIAGMYYNRLKKGMPLQADPTVKFALKDFAIKRIYNDMLRVNSPYNTYKNIGLPPGPIRIPSVAGIEAVLNLVHHDYLYMCAKEDFSGTHNFARTYPEHLQNAAKYSKALNERGIK